MACPYTTSTGERTTVTTTFLLKDPSNSSCFQGPIRWHRRLDYDYFVLVLDHPTAGVSGTQAFSSRGYTYGYLGVAERCKSFSRDKGGMQFFANFFIVDRIDAHQFRRHLRNLEAIWDHDDCPLSKRILSHIRFSS